MAIKKRNWKLQIPYVAMCVALISVCAWISIPFTVCFTMQTFAVFFIAAVSDWKQSFTAMVLYVGLGVLGIPVFAGFQAGPAVFLQATGGYLFGFVLSVLIIGLSVKRFGQKTAVLLLSMVLSLIICYVCGTIWYRQLYGRYVSDALSWWTAISVCVFPFVIPDLLKMTLAITLTKRLSPYLKKVNRCFNL